MSVGSQGFFFYTQLDLCRNFVLGGALSQFPIEEGFDARRMFKY